MSQSRHKHVLIVGAGIAGPTLAYWLLRNRFIVTLAERSPVFRTGGYVIDFWGVGYDVAERMGLIRAMRRAGYEIDQLRFVNAAGQRASSVGILATTAPRLPSTAIRIVTKARTPAMASRGGRSVAMRCVVAAPVSCSCLPSPRGSRSVRMTLLRRRRCSGRNSDATGGNVQR